MPLAEFFNASTGTVGGGLSNPSLACFGARLRAGAPLRIAAFGTSVTAGHRDPRRAERSGSYARFLTRLLRHHVPASNVSVSIYGYPGASVEFMRACINQMLPIDSDLYVIEVADNYMPRTYSAYRGVGVSLEALLDALHRRHANGLGARIAPAALLVAPFPQSCSKPLAGAQRRHHADLGVGSSTASEDGVRSLDAARRGCASNLTLPGVLESLGDEHNLPVASMRLAVGAHLLRSPEPRALLDRFLMRDLIHPNDEGSRLLASLVVSALISRSAGAAGAEAACASAPSRSTRYSSTPFDAPTGVCAFGDSLRAWVRNTSGFSYTIEYSSLGQPKPGFIAVAPAAAIDICYDGSPEVPINVSLGMRGVRSWWQLGFLRSYQGMGMAVGECIAGCTCAPRIWDAHQQRRVSQTDVSKLYVRHHINYTSGSHHHQRAEGSCPCVIRLSVLNRTSSGGHKFKLVALFNGFGRMYNPNFALCPREGSGKWENGACRGEDAG